MPIDHVELITQGFLIAVFMAIDVGYNMPIGARTTKAALLVGCLAICDASLQLGRGVPLAQRQ